ncbi:hypothetical protein pb186bvf_003035 [Paramecium bursaria]
MLVLDETMNFIYYSFEISTLLLNYQFLFYQSIVLRQSGQRYDFICSSISFYIKKSNFKSINTKQQFFSILVIFMLGILYLLVRSIYFSKQEQLQCEISLNDYPIKKNYFVIKLQYMALAINISNQIKTYNLSVCPTLPEFMEDAYKKSKSLKKDESFRRRIEVIQGFEFNTASQQIEQTQDGHYLIASGTYAPSLKIYETAQLSLKCSRGLDSEIVKFCVLDDDYKKIACACEDRNIEFHAQYGKHYKTRVPKQPIDMVYNKFTCDLYIGSSSTFKLNLEEGAFKETLDIEGQSLHINQDLQLLFVGGSQINTIDLKSGKIINTLDQQVSHLHSYGLNLAIGTDEGQIKIFDLRKSQPVKQFQHQYRLPIKKIQYSAKHNILVSADSKIMKFFNLNTGSIFTNIEPQCDINNFTWISDSGLFLVAQEQPRMGIYFVPQLDAAPKWCPFLDNLTEELEEEDSQTVYEEYKFLTYDELEQLDALHLLETKMLKQYLHGYLIHLKLYLKLREQKGFTYENYKQKRIQTEIQQKTEQERISKGYKPQIVEYVNEEVKVVDPRFSKLSKDEDFKVDKSAQQYRRYHGSEFKPEIQKKKRKL